MRTCFHFGWVCARTRRVGQVAVLRGMAPSRPVSQATLRMPRRRGASEELEVEPVAGQAHRTAPRLTLVVQALALLLPLRVLAQATPSIEVQGYGDPASGLRILVETASTSEERAVSADDFENHLKHASIADGFILAYDCDESRLTPDPESPAYLHLYLALPQAAGGELGTIRVWYQKHRLEVKGMTTDGPVELKVSVTGAAGAGAGTLTLMTHSTNPADALVLERGATDWRFHTAGEPSRSIRVSNTIRCPIDLLEPPSYSELEHDLWALPAAPTLRVRTIAPGASVDAVGLGLTPRVARAFIRTLERSLDDSPHTQLVVDIPFQVRGGYQATVRQTVAVWFKPSSSILAVSCASGSILAVLIGLLIPRARSEIIAGAGPSPTRARIGLEVLRQAALAIVVSLVSLFFFVLVKGNTKIILFDVPFDPTQVLSALIFGLIVGASPVVWWERVRDSIPGGRGGAPTSPPGVHPVVAMVLLAAVGTGDAGELFRPISLGVDPTSDRILVGTSSPASVYAIEPASGADPQARLLFRIGYLGAATDHCVVTTGEGLWIASVFKRPAGSARSLTGTGTTTVVLSRVPTEAGAPAAPPTVLLYGFLGYYGVAFDGRRLVFADSVRVGVYAAPILSPPAATVETTIFAGGRLRSPVSIAAAGERVYVGDTERHEVLEVEPATGRAHALMRDVDDPRGIALSVDGRHVFVADAGRNEVRSYDLIRGREGTRLGASVLREPSAVAVDRSGAVWVADPAQGAVLRFTRDGGQTARVRP
jgi:hypothetical protein